MSEFYNNSIFWVEVDRISPNPYQPRKEFNDDKIAELADSIRQYGVLQPLVVTRKETEREDGGIAVEYELIAGERRLRAARELNLKKVPIIVRTAKDLEKLELSLIENIQREDLNPIEKAEAYKRLIDNFHLTQEQAAQRLGIVRSTLNNTLRLLQLPDEIQHDIASGKLSAGQAKLILSLNNKQDQQKIFKRTQQSNLTVKDIERDVRRIKVKSHTRQIKKDPQISKWESQLQQALGTHVKISKRGQQGGIIEIEFYADEELKNIIENIVKL